MLSSVHRSLTDLFQQRQAQDEAALLAKVEDLGVEVEAHRERERALLAAALSAEQIDALAEWLEGYWPHRHHPRRAAQRR
jgi:hypothetical protein